MLELNHHIYPPLSHIFVEKDGTKFRAANWKALEEKVREYRAQRGDPGNVASDILEYTCRTQPACCRDSSPPLPTPRVVRPDRPAPAAQVTNRIFGDVTARVGNWINSKLGQFRHHATQLVPRGEARNRANICQHCPQQQIIASSCGGCLRAIRDARGIILSGEAPVEPVLQACRVLGEDTSLSVHLVQNPVYDPHLPDFCWRKLK